MDTQPGEENYMKLSVLLAICLLLLGCDSQTDPGLSARQTPISADKAIELAKADANRLSSPPRLYVNMGGSVQIWPGKAGDPKAVFVDGTCAGSLLTTVQMTLTTSATEESTTWHIVFGAAWKTEKHSWEFRVGSDLQVSFVSEQGDTLPCMQDPPQIHK
jgi:hypothetical protein